ncbi:MAG: T9SS type A sorting domain-containing protein [Edaphocola sp.]
MKKILLSSLGAFALFASVHGQTTYYWRAAAGAVGTPSDWTVATNWNTATDGTGSSRTTALATDTLVFDGAVMASATSTTQGTEMFVGGIKSEKAAAVKIINTAKVTFASSALVTSTSTYSVDTVVDAITGTAYGTATYSVTGTTGSFSNLQTGDILLASLTVSSSTLSFAEVLAVKDGTHMTISKDASAFASLSQYYKAPTLYTGTLVVEAGSILNFAASSGSFFSLVLHTKGGTVAGAVNFNTRGGFCKLICPTPNKGGTDGLHFVSGSSLLINTSTSSTKAYILGHTVGAYSSTDSFYYDNGSGANNATPGYTGSAGIVFEAGSTFTMGTGAHYTPLGLSYSATSPLVYTPATAFLQGSRYVNNNGNVTGAYLASGADISYPNLEFSSSGTLSNLTLRKVDSLIFSGTATMATSTGSLVVAGSIRNSGSSALALGTVYMAGNGVAQTIENNGTGSLSFTKLYVADKAAVTLNSGITADTVHLLGSLNFNGKTITGTGSGLFATYAPYSITKASTTFTLGSAAINSGLNTTKDFSTTPPTYVYPPGASITDANVPSGTIYKAYSSSSNGTMSSYATATATSTSTVLSVEGSSYTGVATSLATSAPSFNYVLNVNGTGNFRSLQSGSWATASNWQTQLYTGGTWVTSPSAPLGNPDTTLTTVLSGHHIRVGSISTGPASLTIESGGLLTSDSASQRTLRIYGDSVINNGTFGGGYGADSLALEILTGSLSGSKYRSTTITGTGTFVANCMRMGAYGTASNHTDTIVIDQDATFNNAGVGLTAYANATGNTTTDSMGIIINAGKTVKMTNAATLHANSAATANPMGQYFYNINGTLDMRGSSGTSYLPPSSTNAASNIYVNVNGTFKMGAGFNVVNSAPGTTNGNTWLNIGSGGLVDASRTTGLSLGSLLWVTNGGTFRRVVASADTTFPLALSTTTNNSATIKNTGTTDTFAVTLKNTFDVAPPTAAEAVSRQWYIAEAVSGGSNLSLSLRWTTADQGSSFSTASPVGILASTGSGWTTYPATVTGSGTLADPYKATVTGVTGVGYFVVANIAPAINVTGTPLSAFSQVLGTPSTSQSVVASGYGLTAAVTVTPPANFEVSLDSGTTWISNPSTGTLAISGGVVAANSLKIRLNATVAGTYTDTVRLSSTGVTTVNIPVTGVVNPGGIAVTGTPLSTFSQVVGTPSSSQSFVATGTNLTAAAVVTPPANFQVSVDSGVTWVSNPSTASVSLYGSPSSPIAIYVRMNAGAAGTYTDTIHLSSTGMDEVAIPVTGTAILPVLAASGTPLTAFTQVLGTPSDSQGFIPSGTNLSGAVTITPPANYQVSVDSGTTWVSYPGTASLAANSSGSIDAISVKVRLNASAAGTYTDTVRLDATNALTLSIPVTGTVFVPNFTATDTPLTAFTMVLGTPSASQAFVAAGTYLSADVTVAPPANFQVSIDSGANWITYPNTGSIAIVSGSMPSSAIQVRFNASTVGTFTDTVRLSSSGAVLDVVVTGTSSTGPEVVTSMLPLDAFTQTIGEPSATQGFLVSGVNLTDYVTIATPENFEISVDSEVTWITSPTTYVFVMSSGTIAPCLVKVRMNAATTGIYTDTITISGADIDTVKIPVAGVAREATGVPSVTSKLITGVFPNPATARVVIRHQAVSQATLEVWSIDGKLCTRQEVPVGATESEIDVSALSAGTYQILLREASNTAAMLLLKQ